MHRTSTATRPRAHNSASIGFWVEKFIEQTTIHGLPDLYFASKYLKGFWLVVILGALGMAVYGCYSILNEFIARPIGITYVRGDAGEVRLPDLIVCPFNRLDQTFLTEYEIPDELADYLESGFGGVPIDYYGVDPMGNDSTSPPVDNARLEKDFNVLLTRLGMTLIELVNNASLNCSSVIQYCRSPYEKYDCCLPIHLKYVLTMQGRCFRIKGIEQDMGGYGSGLTVRIRLPYDIYHPSKNIFHNLGVSIALVDQGMAMGSNIYLVPEGVHALMPIRITDYKFMNDPPRYSCKDVDQNSGYSAIQCFDECFQAPGRVKCQCTSWNLPDPSYRACSPYELTNCVDAAIEDEYQLLMSQKRNLTDECRKNCSSPCSYREYTASISYTQFPSTTYRKLLPNANLDDFKHDIILDCFYEKLEYTLIEHIPTMTPHQLIGNLGGQLGLWIGASVVSIIQILTFVVNVCLGCIQRKKELKSAKQSTTIPTAQNGRVLNHHNCTETESNMITMDPMMLESTHV